MTALRSGSRRSRRRAMPPAISSSSGGDGVSPILITGNDFAGAWAINPDSTPDAANRAGKPDAAPIWPIRTGVNIVMYMLTGNYKADHWYTCPALLGKAGTIMALTFSPLLPLLVRSIPRISPSCLR